MALSTPASGTEIAAAPLLGGVPAAEPARSSTLWRDAWRRLKRNRLAMAGGIVVVLLCLIAIFADVLSPYSYTKPNFGRINEARVKLKGMGYGTFDWLRVAGVVLALQYLTTFEFLRMWSGSKSERR